MLWSLDFFNPCAFVMHSDLECPSCGLAANVPMLDLVRHPWDERERNGGRSQAERSFFRGAPDPDWLLTTALTERDLILGGRDKLRAALVRVAASPGRPVVVVCCPCPSVVIGEDVREAVERARAGCTVPLLYLAPTPDAISILWDGLVAAVEAPARPPDPGSYALLGFPESAATAELVTALTGAGARPVTGLVPRITPERVAALPGAAVDVVLPNALWEPLYAHILERGHHVIRPPAPYGIDATRAWLEAVLDSLGLGAAVEATWRELFTAERAERWALLRGQAQEHRLGVAVSGEQLPLLADPARTFGVPVVAAILEAGFGLDLVVVMPRAGLEPAASAALGQLAASERCRVELVASPDELDAALTDLECQAILSSYTFDRRATRAGKAPFSMQDFELGVAGALATVERLLCACRAPLFRRYRRYLAGAPLIDRRDA
jgi:hypothetical protein